MLSPSSSSSSSQESANLQGLAQPPVRFASFLGHNAFEFYRRVVAYLGQVTGLPTELVSDLSPEAQDAQVNAGQIHAVFTCGLPYVRKADRQPPLLRLMAAPVLSAPRYQDRPVYYSDVIVRADSPYNTFESLRGTTFAYNESYSLSGYFLPCYHLLATGRFPGFFGQLIRSGAHALSMDWVEHGHATAAAIDSVVLEMELAQRPDRARTLRVVERLGPAPMPPVAATIGLADDLRGQLTQALLAMHTDPAGQAILAGGGVRCFAPVVDSDYHPIRQMLAALQQARATELR